MKNYTLKFIMGYSVIAFSAIAFGISGCSDSKDAKMNHPASAQTQDSLIIELRGQTGKTVFEIIQEKYKIEYRKMPGGVFIKAIDSIESGDQFGWIYSVNGKMAQVASDKYVTSDSDKILWYFRKM